MEIESGAYLHKALIPLEHAKLIVAELRSIATTHPMQLYRMPGHGAQMSVSMTCAGDVGWTSSQERGYVYEKICPWTGTPWQKIPDMITSYGMIALMRSDYEPFVHNSMLLNCYRTGDKLGIHVDKESDPAPVVSMSFGATQQFVFGSTEVALEEGDVFVFGRDARYTRHLVRPLIANGNRTSAAGVSQGSRLALTLRKIDLERGY